MRRVLLAGALGATIAANVASADEATMIVLDASGSMWGQIDGINKVVIAREVVRDSLAAVPPAQSVGLLAYGHSRKGDCSDIAVLVPPAPGQAGAIVTAVDQIKPKGKTPLTDAVRLAAATLQHEENRATVVLVTDGLETCEADPCKLARDLERTGVDFTAHVVGFGLSKADGAAVSCLATETGGQYFKADNAAELAAALAQTVVQQDAAATPTPPEVPQVEPKHNLQINVQLSPDSPPLEEGAIDKLSLDLIRQSDGKSNRIGYSPVMALKAEAGDYILRAKYAGGQAELPFTLEQFDVTHATIALNAGHVDFRAVPLTDGVIDPDVISWRVTDLASGKRYERYEPNLASVFAAGRYEVRVILGRKDATAPAPVTIEVTPGGDAQGEIILPHGALSLGAFSQAGERLPDNFARAGLWTLDESGKRGDFVLGVNGLQRPLYALPGEYLLVFEDWGIAKGGKRQLEQVISITPGAVLSRGVTLPADPAAPLREAVP